MDRRGPERIAQRMRDAPHGVNMSKVGQKHFGEALKNILEHIRDTKEILCALSSSRENPPRMAD